MHRSNRYPITAQDAATQAAALVNCPRFMRDVGSHCDLRPPIAPAADPTPYPRGESRKRRRRIAALCAAAGCIGIGAAVLAGDDTPRRADPPMTMDRLWRAVCIVESGNDPRAVGDDGLAVGIAQIQPIMVRECNRILGRDVFTLADRTDPRLSRLMFDTFTRHYGPGKSAEWITRAWNGGPGWESKPPHVLARTAEYWRRVRAAL